MDHIDVPDGAASDDDLKAFLDEVGSLQFADIDVPEPVACDVEDSYLKTATGPGERAFIQDEVLEGSNRAQDVLVERLQRTRARNRAAQARYRDKIKAECAERAAEIAAVLERLSTARRRGELLRATHAALQHRVAAATDAKLAALRGDSPSSCSAATAHSAVPHGDSHTTPGGPAAVPVATRLLLARRQKHGFRAPPAPPPGHLYTSATNEPGYAVLARRGEAQRTDSWHLFTPPDLLPPPLSTFRHHVAISYADLVEASGSHTAVISFGDAAAWELMNQCMAGVLRRLGCAARDVCWVAQMAYEAAPGLPLSYSCTLSTPECAASCVLFLQALNLEAALISAALQLPGFCGDSGAGIAEELGPTHSPGDGPQSPKRHRPATHAVQSHGVQSHGVQSHGVQSHVHQHGDADTPPQTTPEGATAADGSATPPPQPCRCSEVIGGDGGDGGGGACVRQRCGLHSTCCASAAVRHLVRGMFTRYCRTVPATMLRQILSAMMHGVAAMMDMPPPEDAGASKGSEEAPDAATDAYGQFQAGVSQTVFAVVQMVVAALKEVLAGEHGDAADTHGEVATGGPKEPDAAEAAGDSHGAGSGGAAAALEGRIYETLVSMCIGYQLVQRNAPRVIWSLIAAAVFPRDNFLEVEKFHVHIYKLFKLSEQQKDLYAANWSLWQQRRHASNDTAAAAGALLRAVPATLDTPLPFLRHVSAAAAGELCDDALDFDRSTLTRHERRALDAGPPLLGAAAGAAEAAGAAMRALWTVHDADALMVTETIDLQIQPGALLEPLQIAQAFGVHLLHGTTPIDFMSICRLAATERRRADVRRIPTLTAAVEPQTLTPAQPPAALGTSASGVGSTAPLGPQ